MAFFNDPMQMIWFCQAFFLDIHSKTQGEKTKTQAKKLKAQDFFFQNSKFRQILQKFKKISNQT